MSCGKNVLLQRVQWKEYLHTLRFKVYSCFGDPSMGRADILSFSEYP